MNLAFFPPRLRPLFIGAMLCLIAAQAVAEISLPRAVHTTDTTAYVQASFARVRAMPDTGAEILAQVVTNTPVKLLAMWEDWCELEVSDKHIFPPPKDPNSATSQTIHGFIACRLLAAEPLTLTMVGAQLASGKLDARERLNWQSRAFWIAPSLTRWAAVGMALEALYITKTMRSEEIEAMRPLRSKVQEFEAMKQQLAVGIIVTPESYQETQWQVLQQMQQQIQPMQHSEGMEMRQSPLAQAHQQVKFPKIKASHFRKHEIPVMRLSAEFASDDFWQRMSLVDALSAYNGVSFRVVATSPALFASSSGDYEYVILGVWDVGGLRIAFDGDALLNGIAATGEQTLENLKSILLCAGSEDENNICHAASGDAGMVNKTHVAGYSTLPALVRWAGKPMSGGATAKAQIKIRNLPGSDENDAAIVYEIDLNRDEVADLLILRNHENPEFDTTQWTSIFANIDGQWKLLFQIEPEEEGC